MIMWGTTSPCDELIGDFGVGPEVISIGDPRLFCLIAENQSGGVWGLLQHYLPEADIIKSGNRPRNDAPTTPICFEAGVATPIGTVSGTDHHIVRKCDD